MTFTRALLLLSVATAIGIGSACTNSGLQGDPVTGVATGTGTGNPNVGNPTGGSCELEGTWEVSKAWCGNFEIDNDWFAVYPTTTMEIQDSGVGDGSCSVAFSWSNEQCAEDEDWEITGSSTTSLSIRFGGISACAPDACTFFGSDDTCAVGDRTVADPTDFDLDILQPTQIRLIGLLAAGYPQCTLDLTTEWSQI